MKQFILRSLVRATLALSFAFNSFSQAMPGHYNTETLSALIKAEKFAQATEVLSSIININEQDAAGDTPLLAAMAHSDKLLGAVLAQAIIQAGGNVNVQTQYTLLTPLHWAAKLPANPIYIDALVSDLLAKGADVNAQDNEGNTPLHYAIMRGNFSLAWGLIHTHHASAQVKNKAGQTPLDIGRAKRYGWVGSLGAG